MYADFTFADRSETRVAHAGRRTLAPVPRYLLTRKEVADALGMSVDLFEQRVQPLLKVVVVGRLVQIPPAELERYVLGNARPVVRSVA